MKIISIFNRKGGVAKSHSSSNLALCLSELGYKTLLIDLDPQGNTSLLFNKLSYDHLTVYDVLVKKQPIHECIINVINENLFLLPSNSLLQAGEAEIFADTTQMRETRLKKALKNCSSDYVIIDCPPLLPMMNSNALTASNSVIIPVSPGEFSMAGVDELLNQITITQEDLNPSLTIMGVLITKMGAVGNAYKQFYENLKPMEDMLFKTIIKHSIKVTESENAHIPVCMYAKYSAPAIQYREFAKEVVSRG